LEVLKWKTKHKVDFTKEMDFLDTILNELGIDEATSSIVNVYPNPFIESLSISGLENAEYTIVDNSGKIVLNGKLNQAEVISTANLSAGVYMLSVSNNNTIEKRQIVKQ
jgi:hypothetical protein